MLQNPEAEAFFHPLSAHSDVFTEWRDAHKRLGDYELRYGAPGSSAAVYAITKNIVFSGVTNMNSTYWRLRPRDVSVALATGAVAAPFSSDWVMIEVFRSDWPKPDLPFWALRAYDFARTGQ
jgi:hypothetical protein